MPWRDAAVEAALIGKAPSTEAFAAAADALLADAKGMAPTISRFRSPGAR